MARIQNPTGVLKKVLDLQEPLDQLDFQNMVFPVLNLEHFLFTEELSPPEFNDEPFVVLADITVVRVPAGQIYHVFSVMSTTDSLDADQTAQLQLVVHIPGQFSYCFGPKITINPLERGGPGDVFPEPHIIASGIGIGVQLVGGDLGAAGAIAMRVAVQRRAILI